MKIANQFAVCLQCNNYICRGQRNRAFSYMIYFLNVNNITFRNTIKKKPDTISKLMNFPEHVLDRKSYKFLIHSCCFSSFYYSVLN